jgi:hypothetical protein
VIEFEQRGQLTLARFPIFDEWPDVVAVVSTRHGGISRPPYDGLNLGVSTADDPLHVAQNRRRFFAALGISEDHVVRPHQVHGHEVRYVRTGGFCGDADSAFTDQRGIFVSVSVADCVPILLFDPETGACAAIHAGWRGTAAGVAKATVDEMCRTLSVRPGGLVAAIGPSIGPEKYEVGDEVASQFDRTFVRRVGQRTCLDLWSANRAQLESSGVKRIAIAGECTASNSTRYFSHRASGGRTGRMLAVIGRRA